MDGIPPKIDRSIGAEKTWQIYVISTKTYKNPLLVWTHRNTTNHQIMNMKN